MGANVTVDGEISAVLLEGAIATQPYVKAIHSNDHSILIHGMGGKPRSFYNNLRKSNLVEIMWTGWCSSNRWTYLLSFISGQAGLVKVHDRKQLESLYLDIGGLSMCGLYFVPNHVVNCVLEEVERNRPTDISFLLEGVQDFFLLTVDFDYHGGEKDGEVYYRKLSIGSALDDSVKSALKKIS